MKASSICTTTLLAVTMGGVTAGAFGTPPGEPQTVLQRKPAVRAPVLRAGPDVRAAALRDLATVIDAVPAADASVRQVRAMTAIGSKALELRNLILLRTVLYARLAELREAVEADPGGADLPGEIRAVESDIQRTNNHLRRARSELEAAVHSQHELIQIVSNALRVQHEAAMSAVRNTR